jgi:hypothetical protein
MADNTFGNLALDPNKRPQKKQADDIRRVPKPSLPQEGNVIDGSSRFGQQPSADADGKALTLPATIHSIEDIKRQKTLSQQPPETGQAAVLPETEVLTDNRPTDSPEELDEPVINDSASAPIQDNNVSPVDASRPREQNRSNRASPTETPGQQPVPTDEPLFAQHQATSPRGSAGSSQQALPPTQNANVAQVPRSDRQLRSTDAPSAGLTQGAAGEAKAAAGASAKGAATAGAKEVAGSAAGATGAPGANLDADSIKSAVTDIAHGERPDAKVILDLAEDIPEVGQVLWIIRLGIKLFGEDEEEIAEAIWPKEDLALNPLHVRYLDLAVIVGRILLKLLGLVALNLLMSLIGFIIIFVIFLVAFCQVGPFYYGSKIIGVVSDATGFFNDFTVCRDINEYFEGAKLSVSGGTTTPGPIARGCSVQESGGCTRATISACPGMAAQMDNALRACNQESAGGQVAIASGTDKCELPNGTYISFSIGLWQINMLDSTQPEFPECKDALILTGRDPSRCVTRNSQGECVVTYRSCRFGPRGQAGYDACRQALSNPVRNTRQACVLFNQRGWQPWPYTRRVCRLP